MRPAWCVAVLEILSACSGAREEPLRTTDHARARDEAGVEPADSGVVATDASQFEGSAAAAPGDAASAACDAGGATCPLADSAALILPNDAGSNDAASLDAGAMSIGPDAQAADAGSGDAAAPINVAAGLAGLLWKLPCSASRTAEVCVTESTQTVTAQLGGMPGLTYEVQLRFRGVVERKTYVGSCGGESGFWRAGGTPAADSSNIYRLEISAPHQVYYLNGGSSGIAQINALDFQQRLRIDAGASVTLHADSNDGYETLNLGGPNAPVSVAGSSLAQPYDGQFIEMQVLDVRPDPVRVAGARTASAAIMLNGSQFASVLDAPSLRPADLTLEAWFLASAAPSSYGVVIGKPYQTATANSYAIWTQSGMLHSGANLTSPAGAASLPEAADVSTWHHAALTFEAATSSTALYVDGVPRACVTGTAPIGYDAHPLLLGADIDNGSMTGFWIGALDEARVFAAVRSADQIWADMHTHTLGPTDTLVGEWNFDVGQGQLAVDSSGLGNHARLGGSDASEASDPLWTSVTLPY